MSIDGQKKSLFNQMVNIRNKKVLSETKSRRLGLGSFQLSLWLYSKHFRRCIRANRS